MLSVNETVLKMLRRDLRHAFRQGWRWFSDWRKPLRAVVGLLMFVVCLKALSMPLSEPLAQYVAERGMGSEIMIRMVLALIAFACLVPLFGAEIAFLLAVAATPMAMARFYFRPVVIKVVVTVRAAILPFTPIRAIFQLSTQRPQQSGKFSLASLFSPDLPFLLFALSVSLLE